MKYLGNFKKIILICLKNGWLQKDHFFGFRMSKKEVVRNFLIKEELQTMAAKEFQMERLTKVRVRTYLKFIKYFVPTCLRTSSRWSSRCCWERKASKSSHSYFIFCLSRSM